MMLAMTHPTTSKLLLIAARRAAGESGGVPVRRYRLARLRFDGRAAEPTLRFEHLKRVYE
jgi:hypothetical protein